MILRKLLGVGECELDLIDSLAVGRNVFSNVGGKCQIGVGESFPNSLEIIFE